jgi:putative ABC transport system permease protein
VTVLAAYVPARRAAKTPPIAAMRADAVSTERSLRRRTLTGGVLSGLGAAALIAGSLSSDGSSGASLVGTGALALILGATALSPVLARPFLRIVGAALPRFWGTPGHLARENAVRNPRRTAATASALMIGLALVSAFTVIGASTNKSVDALISGSVQAELVVSSAVQQPFTPQIAEQVAGIDGVQAVMPLRWGQAQVDGQTSFISGVDPATLDDSIALDWVDGSSAGLAGNGVVIDATTATDRGWALGRQRRGARRRRTAPAGGRRRHLRAEPGRRVHGGLARHARPDRRRAPGPVRVRRPR